MALLHDPETGRSARTTREQAVWDKLGQVTDPELDEPVTALGFVASVSVDGDAVSVGFRLPTYWCSANFAWIMAEDMRRAVLSLFWVKRLSLCLDEHMYADTINAGIAAGLSFDAAFGGEADGASLDEVRQTFRRKSFGSRQLVLLQRLVSDGWSAEAILALSLRALLSLPYPQEVSRYLERRSMLPAPFGPDAPAFTGMAGEALTPAGLDAHLAALRSVTINMEFNSVLCRGLLAARYREEEPSGTREPELVDFVREAARRDGGSGSCRPS
jgi:metal-sulfur cluster biosynthetic enzyme